MAALIVLLPNFKLRQCCFDRAAINHLSRLGLVGLSRRSIVEHPFGNLKQWVFGNARFLLRQLDGARAEMALAVNAYNLKRAISALGARQLMALMG